MTITEHIEKVFKELERGITVNTETITSEDGSVELFISQSSTGEAYVGEHLSDNKYVIINLRPHFDRSMGSRVFEYSEYLAYIFEFETENLVREFKRENGMQIKGKDVIARGNIHSVREVSRAYQHVKKHLPSDINYSS